MTQARQIAAELRKYDPKLQRRPRWYVLNKMDLVAPPERAALLAEMRRRMRTKAPMYAISAVTGEGCRDLMWAVQRFLEAHARPSTEKLSNEGREGAFDDPFPLAAEAGARGPA